MFLLQFGINKRLQIFQIPQIALALRACAILLLFEKFTCAYLFQIAKETSRDNLLIIYMQKFRDG